MEIVSSPLGVIEGFYGPPWSWRERQEFAKFLGREGFDFYYYAPKSDAYFRRKWREKIPKEHFRELESLAEICRESGVEFGLGLTPYEVHLEDRDSSLRSLREKVENLNKLGVSRLAILFDDMKGDLPDLVHRQVEILHQVREWSRAQSLVMCPTYYSLDPVLERIFGCRPQQYWEELGELLDPSIDLFWTGEKICSSSYSEFHLKKVQGWFRRPIFLWDNYPVNDSPSLCPFLHLRAVSGRPKANLKYLRGHAMNPMNQPELSRIPLLTQVECYRQGEKYDPEITFRKVAARITSSELAARLEADLHRFQDLGLDRLQEVERQEMTRAYEILARSQTRSPASLFSGADEIIGWLQGRYRVTREMILET